MKKIAIGCDPNAAALKQAIIQHLADLGYECRDYGSDDPIYANVAIAVAEAVAAGEHDRGILMCGTGIGVSIAANKVTGVELAKSLVTIWMNSQYEPGGRSEPKIQRICEYAQQHQK